MKNFFLFSLSVTLLALCGIGGFYVWRQDQAAKRIKNDEFYLMKLTLIEKRELFNKPYDEKRAERLLNESCDLDEAMRKDGYDKKSIEVLTNRAIDNAYADIYPKQG